MKKIFLLLTVLCVLVFFSCRDKEVIICETEPISNCLKGKGENVVNFDTTFFFPCLVEVDFIPINRYDYGVPIFNPNNGNEIIYLRFDNEIFPPKTELWKHNFCTEKISFITDKVSYGIDWSSKDWIVFTGEDRQLWKIKSSGDSLVQLTHNSTFNSHAKWNDEGTQLLYRQDETPQIGLVISDENGEIIDTLNDFFPRSWNWNNDIITYSDGIIVPKCGIYNKETKEKTVIESSGDMGVIGIVKYSDKRQSIYWNGQIFGATNINSLERTDFLYDVSNRRYLWFDINPNEDIVIITRSNTRKIDDCTLESELLLYLVDVEMGEERRLSIPE